MTQAHLDPELIAVYAERRLTGQERTDVEAHLASCTDCRAEASATAVLIREERRRRHRLIAAPLVAAAAVLLLVVVTDPFSGPGPETMALRPGDGTEGVAPLAAYAPGDGSTLTRAALRFTWQKDGPDATYRFTLADRSGLPLWQVTTADTSLAPPDSLALGTGETYLWYVDVLLPDAQKATTGVREFTLGE